ncbi:hypothetical protein LIER_14996 [Lithospermum erythrorhizon]|uniref:Uncharacterized protein n=1 Tax=Lithospermum erythrorhizon TaxID=34254 RepID=A0AAV3Q324_LITER
MLQQKGGTWAQELPTVLWSFRTIPNPITGETPFSLVYGSNALLLVEIHADTARVTYYDELANEQGLRLNLGLLERKRAIVVDKMAKYKKKWGLVTYELETLEGREVPRSWNAFHLRKYYV